MRIYLLPLGLLILVAPLLQADDQPVPRIGEVAIFGNHKTSQQAILEEIGLFPGRQIKDRREFILAERQLLFRFRSHFDPQTGQVPRLILTRRKGNSQLYDLHIWFPEKGNIDLPKNRSLFLKRLNNPSAQE